MAAALDWDRDGRDWPHRAASRFVEAGGLRWHVQQMGAGPSLLLLHGTGASSHSWRGLAPLLAARYSVIAPDLPGHAYTPIARGDGMSLPGMAGLVAELCSELGVAPAFAIGHSAGAAILARMALDSRIAPRGLVSLNGAFVAFAGVLRFLSPIARLLAATPLAARVFAARAADAQAVQRLLDGTGSHLDAEGTALYARLVRSAGHVHGALAMMAGWQLDGLEHELARLPMPMLLIAADNDRTVPPVQAERVAARIPKRARVEHLPGLGHLAHEEDPARLDTVIERFFESVEPNDF